VQAAKRGRSSAVFKSAVAALVDLPTLVNTALWRYWAKQKYWPTTSTVQLKIWIEQLPHWSNHIVLSDSVDALGQPLMRFEFRKTDDEERAFHFTVERIRAFWERHMSGLATLDWIPAVDDAGARLVDLSVELAHPAGSTRMGTDPATSVVDPWLRVHRVPNLSIASASVFPASGSANPTFTIMQLAMRAADAIAARLHPR
jgi:choline dehydrogenase-like flavoprotein